MPISEEVKDDAKHINLSWNEKQYQFIMTRGEIGGAIEYIDFEGAVRAGKTTPSCAKLVEYAVAYPGIHMAATRWAQDALDAQVRPAWRDMAAKFGLTLKWHADEQFDEVVGTGSRIYLRALRSTDERSRYSKLAGLTLAVVWADQPEEIPEDVYRAYVPARLSQPKYPHEVWLTPNPPGESHWLAKDFPLDPKLLPKHKHYILTSVYDNRMNLGEAYISDMETAYPPGSVLRRRFIDGHRGLSIIGTPVYKGYYNRAMHEKDVEYEPEVPLLMGWDFGAHHPCCVFAQFLPWGEFRILGGVMGETMFLEDFVPVVLQYQKAWFPNPCEVRATGDPAGSAMNSQGTMKSASDVLKSFGIYPQFVTGANAGEKRFAAIQGIAGYMRRLTERGPAFSLNSRFWVVSKHAQRMSPVTQDALEAGYVWAEESTTKTSHGVQRPRKDGHYDHQANCLEYIYLQFGPAIQAPMTQEQVYNPDNEMVNMEPGGWMGL